MIGGVGLVWQTLDEAKQEALGCTRCRLSQGRTQVVWMDGDPESELMFIGEGPGFHEDRQGVPFVGAAGKLLDKMLSTIDLSRQDCTICNVIKCRPPSNRDPRPDEIETCRPYLEAQVKFIAPRVIVPLGNFATRFVLDRKVSISRVRGQKFEGFGAIVMPTYHPAAVLHGGGEDSPTARALREDFGLIRDLLAEAEAMGSQEADDEGEPESEGTQQALF